MCSNTAAQTCPPRFEVSLENEKEALRSEKTQLYKEVEKERNEIEMLLKKKEKEAEKGQKNLEQVHDIAVGVLKREFESSRAEQHNRHAVGIIK